jgi:hypothetical protein
MKMVDIIGNSSLDELARQFWEREAKKHPHHEDVLAIQAGADPYKLLKTRHDYKLPRDHNNIVKIARLNRDELGALEMRKDTVDENNQWAVPRGLVPEPFTQVLSGLASWALGKGYFDNCDKNDGQLKHYRDWKYRARPALRDAITGFNERCSIQLVGSDQYEIIDGYGRLLPFEALLQQGYEFHPVEVFLCLPSG